MLFGFNLLTVCVQFADGVYLILLMGLLEDYFVPLYNFFLTPESFEQKVISPNNKTLVKVSVRLCTKFAFFLPSGPQCVICL